MMMMIKNDNITRNVNDNNTRNIDTSNYHKESDHDIVINGDHKKQQNSYYQSLSTYQYTKNMIYLKKKNVTDGNNKDDDVVDNNFHYDNTKNINNNSIDFNDKVTSATLNKNEIIHTSYNKNNDGSDNNNNNINHHHHEDISIKPYNLVNQKEFFLKTLKKKLKDKNYI